jgi:uncharacterized damage-inducible protein DinB
MSRELAEQYSAGGKKLAESIRGLAREDLTRKPPADAPANLGKWSIHEVVLHLQDAELAFADRIKRIVAEEDPKLEAWDEEKFAERLHYHDQSTADAVSIVELTRKQVSVILSKLAPADFQRTGTHSARGRQTLTDVLKYCVPHLDHHLNFIRAKREWMKK